MMIVPTHYAELEALGLIEQLRDALIYADSELQRRCIISNKVRGASRAAEAYLEAKYVNELPRYRALPSPRCRALMADQTARPLNHAEFEPTPTGLTNHHQNAQKRIL
jgi:hypothetical protein